MENQTHAISQTVFSGALNPAASANYTSDEFTIPSMASGLIMLLDITAIGTVIDDTFDLYLQTKIGNDWFSIFPFTQKTGDLAAQKQVIKLNTYALASSAGATDAEFTPSATDANIRFVFGDKFRIYLAIVEGVGLGHDPKITFTLTAKPM